MTRTAIRHCRVLDPVIGTVGDPRTILIEDGRIVSVGPDVGEADIEIDATGLIAMPGLIDSHVHLSAAANADLSALRRESASYVAIRAMQSSRAMLSRGFTRVRDMGGADWGLAQAVSERPEHGPQISFCGRALSQTGGHGDMRLRGEQEHCCGPGVGGVVDGVTELIRAVREELRLGAAHVKLMLSGGVSSPTDSIDSLQFSPDEIVAAVEEASRWGAYVAGHAYTSESIERAVGLGVRTIEHGNLANERALRAISDAGAYLVPNLVAYYHHGRGETAGIWRPEYLEKNGQMLEEGMKSLELAHHLGLNIGFGSDLLGTAQTNQSDEFRLRSQVQDSASIIRSATTIGAEILGVESQAGSIEEGFDADLLLLDSDPIVDIRVLARPERHIRYVIKGGFVAVSN